MPIKEADLPQPHHGKENPGVQEMGIMGVQYMLATPSPAHSARWPESAFESKQISNWYKKFGAKATTRFAQGFDKHHNTLAYCVSTQKGKHHGYV
ncbi:hypothetical protein [Nereida ignava]|nr:hypothetical protein [Nereida ignava]